MDARADLERSVNSCRTLKNFQIDQYGEAIRRPGLEYVGGALGECLAIDPLLDVPAWDELIDEETFAGVDVYGAIGPDVLRQIDHPASWWLVCDWLCYCDGPEEEGQTMTGFADRYMTRWRAKLEGGNIYYSKVGEEWQQVSQSLISQPNENFNGLGFCFDQNGRPVFATQIGARTYIYRWQGGTPTSHDFDGIGPKLFLDAVVQREITLWDVVCYYADSGDLCAGFQRENFGTKYVLYHSGTNYISKVKNVDYLRSVTETGTVYIAATGALNLRALFKAGPYQPWPVVVSDQLSQSIAVDSISFALTSVSCGVYDDAASFSVGVDGIEYSLPIVEFAQEADGATQSVSVDEVTYSLIAVDAGSYSDGASGEITIEAIDYSVTSVNAGTYDGPMTQSISVETIDYATS